MGFVSLLRWYWWRINAWSEISALVSSFLIANGNIWAKGLDAVGLVPAATMDSIMWFYSSDAYPLRLVVIVCSCTVIWLGVTFATSPEPAGHLEAFYRRVRPGGWWGPVAEACPDVPTESARRAWIGWISGVVSVYSGLFGVGYICIARTGLGLLCLGLAFGTGWLMLASVPAKESEMGD